VDKRIFLFLLPVLLVGCGQPSGETSGAEEPSVADQPVELADPNGFFTELSQFNRPGLSAVGDKTDLEGPVIVLNQRHDLMIKPFVDRIKGARMLDFGSYNGMWTYAAIQAGAEHVTGIEIDPAFAAEADKNLQELGVPADKYDFITSDIMDALENIEPGSYDGVLLAGVFYHITYHVELMEKLKQLGIKWIIMDTTIAGDERPITLWVDGPHGFNRLEGVPSRRAVEWMAEAAGYKYDYVPVDHLTSRYMWDYKMGLHITMLIHE
jgi:2-polyprenyl-3-methyl-5-hydroxy-6-metoxy-1,4-benzoquinol methylase